MSFITNVIISCSGENFEERTKEINSFHYRHLKMNLLSLDIEGNKYGGTKPLLRELLVGGFNQFDEEGFIKHLSSGVVKWEDPEFVQLFMMNEEESSYRVYEYEGSELKLVLNSKSLYIR